MLKIIKNTLDRITGADPETGDILYPPHEYISYCILKEIEEFGMLAPLTEKIVSGQFIGSSSPLYPHWDQE